MIRRVRIRAVQNGGMKIGGLSLGKEWNGRSPSGHCRLQKTIRYRVRFQK